MMRVGSAIGIATSCRTSRGHHEQPFLAVVLELGELDGVLPRVKDRGIADPVRAGGVRDLHIVKYILTRPNVNDSLTAFAGQALPAQVPHTSAAYTSLRVHDMFRGNRETHVEEPFVVGALS